MELVGKGLAGLFGAAIALSILASGVIDWDVILRVGGTRGINAILATFGRPTGGATINPGEDDWECTLTVDPGTGVESLECSER